MKSCPDGDGPPRAIATPCVQVCVVDGGSGYLAQDEYVVLAPTAVAAPHRASVAFRASPDVPNRIVEFDIRPGEFARVYEPSREHPRGRIEMSRMPPRQAK